MRILGVAIGLALVMVGGCNSQSDPSGADASPTREVAITSRAERHTPGVAAGRGYTPSEGTPTAETPAAEGAAPESATASVEPTPQPRGTATAPPRMPTVASEQTDAGATAFVGYYLDRVSWAHEVGDAAGLASLGLSTCRSCQGLIENVETGPYGEDYIDYQLGEPLLTDTTARVEVTVQQLVGDGAGEGVVVVRLEWVDGAWLVQEITLVE